MDNSGHASFPCPLKTITVDDFGFHRSPRRRRLDQRIPESSSSSVMAESVKGSLSQGLWAWGPMSFSSTFCGQDTFLSSESMNSQHTSSVQKGTEKNLGTKEKNVLHLDKQLKADGPWNKDQPCYVPIETLTYRSDSHDELLTVSPRNWRRGNRFKSQQEVYIIAKKKFFFKSTHSKRSMIMFLCLWEDAHVLVHARSVIQRFSHVPLVWAQIPVLWNSDRSKPHWNLCRNQHLRWKLKWWQMSECLPEQIRLRHSAHVRCHFSKRLLWHLLGMTSFSLLWAERMKYQEKELNIWNWGLGDI